MKTATYRCSRKRSKHWSACSLPTRRTWRRSCGNSSGTPAALRPRGEGEFRRSAADVQRVMESVDWQDAFRDRPLACSEHLVDQRGHQRGLVDRVDDERQRRKSHVGGRELDLDRVGVLELVEQQALVPVVEARAHLGGHDAQVGLLVDASNSVRDRFKFEQESAIKFFSQILRPRTDQAFVLAFDSEFQAWIEAVTFFSFFSFKNLTISLAASMLILVIVSSRLFFPT